MKFIEQRGLKWFHSSTDETPNVHRGFWEECDWPLFWHPKDQKMIAIAAGSLDNSADLNTIGHTWLSHKGDCYTISDGLPKFDKGWPKGQEAKLNKTIVAIYNRAAPNRQKHCSDGSEMFIRYPG